ncbi:MAG TPA: holo-ACP synthase [Kiritimatiellia bacterium]|nr:holo-ACP synthase [Kiritimatiellia bacterium]HRZ11193.1 holo-ACP synthase [Kiritimatiellia bacterium]HSA19044.1 holo-ACP synthase [Kiritimatiellia bacterium]
MRRTTARAGAPVLGVGVDLVENERMQSALRRWGRTFREKVFRPAEQSYCDGKAEPWRHYAGRFAIKEAVSKAFGTGIGEHLGWLDIEVRRDPASGAPSVQLSAKGGRLARRRGVGRVLVSLSHTRHYAVAQALLVGGARKEKTR